jgi:hypothetical protein
MWKEAAPLSVTRTQRLGTALSQMTVRLPGGAGLSPRNVLSVKSFFILPDSRDWGNNRAALVACQRVLTHNMRSYRIIRQKI